MRIASLIRSGTALVCVVLFSSCAGPEAGGSSGNLSGVAVRQALLPRNVHGRLVRRTMRPRYITIHGTENIGGTAQQHAQMLFKGRRSRNNPRFGRSGWIVWHYTVDHREAVQHLLPTEQGDHADYGGGGDRSSIGIEICEFRSRSHQAASIDRAARLAAALANRYGIPTRNIVPHQHWPRWDYARGKPCPRLFLVNGRVEGGAKWKRFLAQVDRYR